MLTPVQHLTTTKPAPLPSLTHPPRTDVHGQLDEAFNDGGMQALAPNPNVKAGHPHARRRLNARLRHCPGGDAGRVDLDAHPPAQRPPRKGSIRSELSRCRLRLESS